MTQQYTDWLYTIGYNSPFPSGVYAIVNIRTSEVYVGSTVDLTRRSAQHFKALEEGLHHNRTLQYSFDTTGPSGFTFIVLEYVPDEDRLEATEQRWLNRLRSKAVNSHSRVSRENIGS